MNSLTTEAHFDKVMMRDYFQTELTLPNNTREVHVFDSRKEATAYEKGLRDGLRAANVAVQQIKI